MDDMEIIELYNLRSEKAIEETSRKYGDACGKIAEAILKIHEDAEECVNTSYYKLWSTIPPKKPESFCGYLFATVRNTALSVYRRMSRSVSFACQELDEVMADKKTLDSEIDSKQLADWINGFLSGANRRSRELFTARYYFNLSVADIAESFCMSESAVKTRLLRIRRQLRTYLEERGVNV